MNATLACSGVSFRYNTSAPWVLKDFSHSFRPGTTVIKGVSGCGKSTLLRLLAGFLQPNKGTVSTPMGNNPNEPAFRRKELGYVFQQLNLLPLANIRRNLELSVSIPGISTRAKKDRLHQWLHTLGFAWSALPSPCSCCQSYLHNHNGPTDVMFCAICTI